MLPLDNSTAWIQDNALGCDIGLHDTFIWSSLNDVDHSSTSASDSYTPEHSSSLVDSCSRQANEFDVSPSTAIFGHESETSLISSTVSSSFRWTDDNISGNHTAFFGLDLGAGYGFEVTPHLTTPASDIPVEENLLKWAEVATKSQGQSPRSPDSVAMSTSVSGLQKGASISKRARPSESNDSRPATKVHKTFHFVDNDNKKEAARLRNTMTSRNLRQSKVSRIAELERLLEESRREANLWEGRARSSGWTESNSGK